MFPNFDYVRPKSLQAAITHLSDEGAVVHAGGTDLLGCLREHIFAVKKVVSISAVRELHGIAEGADGTLRIGALTTTPHRGRARAHPQTFQRSCSSGLRSCQPAAAQPGNHRRQHLPETALLVLPGGFQLPAQGRRHLFRRRRGEPVSLHLRGRRHLFYGSPLRHSALPGGPQRNGTCGRAQRGARCAPGEIPRAARGRRAT